MARHRARKDPQAELDYGFDWGDGSDCWLTDGDYIVQSTWSVTGPDNTLLLETPNIVSKNGNGVMDRTVIWLVGSTAQERYTVTNRVVSFEGRKDERSMTVSIFNK
jgi:hypothetical protein